MYRSKRSGGLCLFILVVILCLGLWQQKVFAQEVESIAKNQPLSSASVVATIDTIARSFALPDISTISDWSKSFLSVEADTSTDEYAGFFLSSGLGGNLSGYSDRFEDYPGILTQPVSIETGEARLRSLSVGFTTDTPMLFPLFARHNNTQAKGLRWGLTAEFQRVDIAIKGNSSTAWIPDSTAQSGRRQISDAQAIHGGYFSLSSLAFTPTLRYAFQSKLNIQIGLRMGLVFSSQWRVEDSLVAPDNAEFLQIGARARREVFVGNEISGLNINPTSLVAGLGYSFFLDPATQIRPEITVQLPMTEETNWSNRISLHGGISLLFNTRKITPLPDTTYRRDTLLILTSADTSSLTLRTKTVKIQPSTYPNDEPAKVWVFEEYERREPKPKPLISGRLNAEFLLAGGVKRKYLTVENEKIRLRFKVWRQSLHEESMKKEDNEEIVRDIARIIGKNNGYHISDNHTSDSAQELDSLPKKTFELTDTLSVAQDLPSIAFTPVIVAESDIKGIEIHVWKNTSLAQENTARRDTLFLIKDAEGGGKNKIYLWQPDALSKLWIQPDDTLGFCLIALDEDTMRVPIDTGAIFFRGDQAEKTSAKREEQSRSVTIYAFTQSQWSALQISSALKEYEMNIQDYTGTKRSVALVLPDGAEGGKANFGEIISNVELMIRKLTERSSSFSSISQPISKRHIRGISQPYLLIIFE